MLWPLLFCAGIGLPLYVLFIYPALLGIASRRHLLTVGDHQQEKTVSVIIAVRNGERFIAEKLRSVLDLNYPRELVEIIVVSDGSTDATESIVQQFSQDGVRLLRVPARGKPSALNAGIAASGGEILLLTDVRQVLGGESLQFLVDRFADAKVGVVSGRLLIRKGNTGQEAAVGLYWRYETWIRTQLSRLDSTFGAVGPFYAMRRALAVHIPEQTLLDDVYLPLAAYFAGYRLIVEDRALAWDYPLPLETEFRRKVRTIAGNYQILRAYPQLLGWRNRMWFHFMSYKIGRLLLPYALVLACVSCVFLPAPWNRLLAGAQAVLYGMAAADPVVPEGTAVKRVTSLLRAFATLVIATICALQVFFVPPKGLWRVTNPNVNPVGSKE